MPTSNTLKVYKNGDSAFMTICYVYSGSSKKDGVIITIGGIDNENITVTSIEVNKGVVDQISGEWLLSSLIPGVQYCTTIYFTIDNTCVLKDGIEFTLSDDCECTPEICETFDAIGCCETMECFSNVPAYANTAAAAADVALLSGSVFMVTNGDNTSALHIKN